MSSSPVVTSTGLCDDVADAWVPPDRVRKYLECLAGPDDKRMPIPHRYIILETARYMTRETFFIRAIVARLARGESGARDNDSTRRSNGGSIKK